MAKPSLTGGRLSAFLNGCRVSKGQQYNFSSMAKPFGSYYIPEAKLADFYDVYCDTVEAGTMPHLTEKPGPFGPMLVDFDFKYGLDVVERRYDAAFVRHVVAEYFRFLAQYVELDDANARCYVFERSAPYQAPKVTKDGIHLMFPFVHSTTPLKLMARMHVMEACRDAFLALGTTNPVADIVDRAVIDCNNWFVFGSGKPGCEPYRLTSVLDAGGGEHPTDMALRDLVPLLSVKGTTLPDVRFLEGMEEELDAQHELATNAAARQAVTARRRQTEQVDRRIRGAFEQCANLPFVRKLAGLLSAARADDYSSWMQVGWCLHNIDPRASVPNREGVDDSLLAAWTAFSGKSAKFAEGVCEGKWADMRRDGGLGMGSLVRWAREDDPEGYEKARGEDIIDLINHSAATAGAHHSVAKVLHAMYRYQFICVSRKFKSWIEFRQHRWHRIEEAHSLQTKLSKELYDQYARAQMDALAQSQNTDDLSERETFEKRKAVLSKIGTNLLQTVYKKNIMTEAAELFYCEGLEDKLDSNRTLLGFENGVYDLLAGEFRDGRPEDFITLSTGIDCVPHDPDDEHVRLVRKVFREIHVDPDIREYIFMLLSSFLSGENKAQKFHMWTGESGSNGKSFTVEMFMKALGSYSVILPISLLTAKRSASNAASPELARTKGRRFCVLQEPEEDVRVNVGLLKELSGGDQIVSRELYGPILQFAPQFKMALTCNRLPEIPSQDGGTWRRIRVVEFQSRFCEDPDPTDPRQFPVDTTLGDKMPELACALMSILLEYHKKYRAAGDKVKEPDAVIEFTRLYQQRSDTLLDFVNQHIVQTGVRTDLLRLGEVYMLLKEWYRANAGDNARVPSSKDVKEYLESKFGKANGTLWRGYSLRIVDPDADPDDEPR